MCLTAIGRVIASRRAMPFITYTHPQGDGPVTTSPLIRPQSLAPARRAGTFSPRGEEGNRAHRPPLGERLRVRGLSAGRSNCVRDGIRTACPLLQRNRIGQAFPRLAAFGPVGACNIHICAARAGYSPGISNRTRPGFEKSLGCARLALIDTPGAAFKLDDIDLFELQLYLHRNGSGPRNFVLP